LNAVGHVPHRLHDPAVTGYVIEKLKVVNVHVTSSELMLWEVLSIHELAARAASVLRMKLAECVVALDCPPVAPVESFR